MASEQTWWVGTYRNNFPDAEATEAVRGLVGACIQWSKPGDGRNLEVDYVALKKCVDALPPRIVEGCVPARCGDDCPGCERCLPRSVCHKVAPPDAAPVGDGWISVEDRLHKVLVKGKVDDDA